jgi:hypothetical protein
MDQYEAGEIDLETLAFQTLHHVAILYTIKEINKIVINGLLEDVGVLADHQQVERPSAASRERLKEWRRQAQEAAAAADRSAGLDPPEG